MPSYLVTGANRGLGLAFVRILLKQSDNLVIGMVRNKAAIETETKGEFAGKNIHWVEADLAITSTIKPAIEQVSAITGGKLDVVIANAALISGYSAWETLDGLAGSDPVGLEKDLIQTFQINAVGQIFLFHEVLPLIRKGTLKKVVGLGTAMADEELVLGLDVTLAGPYSISKAAFNLVIAKFQAEFRKEGILFVSISPGAVNTGGEGTLAPDGELRGTPAQIQRQKDLLAKFAAAAPQFKRLLTPEESATAILETVASSTIEKVGGKMVSHHGDRNWL